MSKNFYSYKTKNYLVKSPEITENAEGMFTQNWNVYSATDNSLIGTFSFNGMQKLGCVNLIYNFDRITESGELKLIFSYICRWAFSQKFVYTLQTTFPKTKEYTEVFDYLPYKKENTDGNVAFKASQPINTVLFLFLGMVLGIIFGIIIANIKTGIIFGLVVLGGIGIIRDANYKRIRNFIENKD